jgi:ribosomal protein S18 acetylase RimI-like enzyme
MLASLKDGRNYEIRPITKNDADARHEFFAYLTLNQEGMIHKPEELGLRNYETVEKINDWLHNHRGLWLIAVLDEKVIGEIDITVKDMDRIRHVGALTMGVLPDFQGQGVGSKLLEESIRWSKAQGLTRLELFVFATNHKAQNIYQKFGFVEEGVRKNYLRHDDGTYEDDWLLAKYL